MREKNNTNHFVGHSLMKPIDVNKLLNRRFIISGLEDSLNDDDKIYASGIAEVQTETSVIE